MPRRQDERREPAILESKRRGHALLIALSLATLVVTSVAPAPAKAADMRHRLEEHLIEAYFIASLGTSLTGRNEQTVPGFLSTQLGAGVVFPGTGCLRLGAWGLELTVGPAIPLNNPDLGFDTHFSPSFFLEAPISNLQLIGRFGAILPVASDNAGISAAFLFGWYARPMSFRVGVAYEVFEGGQAFTGLRFELLWLGEDPIPPS